MIISVYDRLGADLIEQFTATPIHGMDYCDTCGDCLDCHAEDACRNGGDHFWVVYEPGLPEWRVYHPEAAPVPTQETKP